MVVQSSGVRDGTTRIFRLHPAISPLGSPSSVVFRCVVVQTLLPVIIGTATRCADGSLVIQPEEGGRVTDLQFPFSGSAYAYKNVGEMYAPSTREE